MIRIAAGGPTCPDRMPIIITPTGPVPMHMVTIPITRDRVAGGASVKINVVCIFEKAAVPSPPISNSTKASEYHGDSGHRREAHQEQQRSAQQGAVPAQAQPTRRQRDADRDGADLPNQARIRVARDRSTTRGRGVWRRQSRCGVVEGDGVVRGDRGNRRVELRARLQALLRGRGASRRARASSASRSRLSDETIRPVCCSPRSSSRRCRRAGSR